MTVERLAEFQARCPERVIGVGGGEWRVRQTSSAPVNLMLLPGAQGTGDVFYKTALDLEGRICCITVTPPAWSEIERLAEGLKGVLDVLGLARVELLGSSLFGYLAQAFALKHPERVGTLFLASTFFDASEIQRALPSPEQLAKLAPEVVASEMPGWLVPPSEASARPSEVKTILRTMVGSRQPFATLKSRAMALALCQPVDAVPLPPERVVIIDADDDPVVPSATRKALRERYRDSVQHNLPGGGHYPAILSSDAFAKVLANTLLR